MRINSLNRITRVVDRVYAKFGVVDSFGAIVKLEDSLGIFHCYTVDSKVDDNRRYPEYKVFCFL
jgi:hypothetical protein